MHFSENMVAYRDLAYRLYPIRYVALYHCALFCERVTFAHLYSLEFVHNTVHESVLVTFFLVSGISFRAWTFLTRSISKLGVLFVHYFGYWVLMIQVFCFLLVGFHHLQTLVPCS